MNKKRFKGRKLWRNCGIVSDTELRKLRVKWIFKRFEKQTFKFFGFLMQFCRFFLSFISLYNSFNLIKIIAGCFAVCCMFFAAITIQFLMRQFRFSTIFFSFFPTPKPPVFVLIAVIVVLCLQAIKRNSQANFLLIESSRFVVVNIKLNSGVGGKKRRTFVFDSRIKVK